VEDLNKTRKFGLKVIYKREIT